MTSTTLPVAADLTEPATQPPRITVVATADWPPFTAPGPATVLGYAEGWDIAAQAREHFGKTGCAPADLPGFTPAGE